MTESGEHRTNSRTSLFAAAVLDTGTAHLAVRIRNISATGALIQADELPPAGTGIRLIRGGLSASGELRWTGTGKAGLSFTENIRVAEWLASCSPKGHQNRVDTMVAAIRTSADLMPSKKETSPLSRDAPETSSETLLRLQQIINEVAERLAADPISLERHAGEIQQLDAAASIAAALAQHQLE